MLRQEVFAMVRETLSDFFSKFCIWIVVPLMAVSLLYLLIKSGNLLLWTIFPLLAVVFFIKKQITKAKAPQHYNII